MILANFGLILKVFLTILSWKLYCSHLYWLQLFFTWYMPFVNKWNLTIATIVD